MSLQNIIVPQMGESIHEVSLIKIYKKVGDTIKIGDTIADLATDKVDTELVATASGTIEQLFFKEKAIIPIGAVFASVNDGKAEFAPVSKAPSNIVVEKEPVSVNMASHSVVAPITKPTPASCSPVATSQPVVQTPSNKAIAYLSPIVTQYIFEHQISQQELAYISGTGEDNRITKKDIVQYLQTERSSVLESIQNSAQHRFVVNETSLLPPLPQNNLTVEDNMSNEAVPTPNAYIGKTEIKYHPTEGETTKPLDRTRLTISKNLKQSKDTNVQVTSFAEIDVTNIVLWREKTKHIFEERTHQKLTYTPIIIEALIATLKEYPLLNNVLKTDMIVERSNINIGVATALPDGNLIVPVIKKTQEMNLVELAKQLNALVAKARTNALNYSDIDGGTFTLTNIGTFNSLMGTPILPPNQSGILATGMIQKKPIIQNTTFGEALVVRHMMFVSLSYDHRIIDGIVGGGFLNFFAKQIETFNPNRSILF